MKEFDDILKSYVTNTSCDVTLTNELIHLFSDHSLAAMLYSLYPTKELKSIYVSCAITQERFKEVKQEVTSALNQKHIRHLYVKGIVLQQYYDDPVIRTHGDIDLYVNIEDFSSAKEILLGIGFQEHPQDCMHHIALYKNGIEVELHFSLFDDYGKNKVAQMFKNPFDYAIGVCEYEYMLNPSYHFIYCVCHFATHLRYGCGVRYILDFYYMLLKTEVDYTVIHQAMQMLELTTLYNNILNLIYYYTDKVFEEFNKSDIQYFLDYLISSGIHGYKDLDSTKKVFNRKNPIRYAFSRLFMTNRAYRLILYPNLGRHWYTYPLILIHHTGYLLVHKLGKFFKILCFKDKEKNKLYKKMGI